MSNKSYFSFATAMAVTDTGDFFQLRNAASMTSRILEIRVWQTSDTTLAINDVRFRVGSGAGSGGSGLTERSNVLGMKAPSAAAFSLPTGDVTTFIQTVSCGWAITTPFVWLPTPEFQLEIPASHSLGISLETADTLTIGCGVWWKEE